VVRDTVAIERLSLVCLQETKLDVISDFDLMQTMGNGFDYSYLPVVHTRGGILIAWHAIAWLVSSISVRTYSVSVMIKEATSCSEYNRRLMTGTIED
jgi:hypothetical protein